MIFLIEHILPRGYFDQTLRALSVDLIVLRDLLYQRLPKTKLHLDNLQKSRLSFLYFRLFSKFLMNISNNIRS